MVQCPAPAFPPQHLQRWYMAVAGLGVVGAGAPGALGGGFCAEDRLHSFLHPLEVGDQVSY